MIYVKSIILKPYTQCRMSRDWRNEHLCSFSRVIALCCCYHHCTLENECMWWWQAAAAKSNHPRKWACMLVSEGRGWQGDGGSSKEQSPTTLENERICSFLRVQWWWQQQKAITLENEHVCSFSRVIGGGACAQNECGGWPNVTPLPMGSKKFVSTQIIGISKRTYLVRG